MESLCGLARLPIAQHPVVVGVAIVLIICYAFYRSATKTDFPVVDGIPQVPKSSLFIGDLRPLGGRQKQNDSSIYTQWARDLKADVFQMRLGRQRTLVANSFQAIRDLWVGHANELIDRPFQHGFAEYLDYDLSGASMTEDIRRCRKAAMRALGKPMWSGYYPLLEPSSVNFIKNAFTAGNDGTKSIETYSYLRQVVFDLALSLTYGTRMTGENNDFVVGLIDSINAISHVRASTKRFRDYTPVLRLLEPAAVNRNVVVSAEKIRQQHLDVIYTDLQRRQTEGEHISCIVTGLVNDKLSLPEAHGTCKAILQAAPDSTASSIYMGVAWLCSSEGRSYQDELYAAIMAAYNGHRDRAWDMAFREEIVPQVVSFYKETLRFWTITPWALPRTTTDDIVYREATIPKGVTLIMNAQQGNHDESWYGDSAKVFNPTRFMGNDTNLPHLTFGAGSRICPAAALSNRIIYAMIFRLILAFEMTEGEGSNARKPNLDPVDFSDVHDSVVAMPGMYDCCYRARDAEWLANKWKGAAD